MNGEALPVHVKLPLEEIRRKLEATTPLYHWWGLDRLGVSCCTRCGLLRTSADAQRMCRRNGG